MQVMYAVDMEVFGTGSVDATQSYDVLVQLLCDWVAKDAQDAPALSDLRSDGRAIYRKRGFGGEPGTVREAKWQLEGDDVVRALRVDLRQPLDVEGAWFFSRVTISRDASGALFRMVMARVTSGWLSPVPVEKLRRPALVRHVVKDPRLRVTVMEQVIDDRYLRIGTSAELALLVAAITNANRLPLLVVHPLGDSGYKFVNKVANELLGMARVACLMNQPTWFDFNQGHSRAPVPFGGARLYWPDPNATQPDFTRVFLENAKPDEVAHRILRILAPVSVVARGRDRGWEAATAAGRAVAAKRVERQLSVARARGDNVEENRVLRARVEQLAQDVEEWIELNEGLFAENNALESQIRELDQHKHQAEIWRAQYLALLGSSTGSGEVDLTSAPEFSYDRIPVLLDFIEKWSKGSCRFTDNAAQQWKKSKYPFQDKMRSTLLALARASVRFADQRGSISTMMDDWFRENFRLKVAMGDKKLVALNLHRFTFEGDTLSRVPHVKLDDHTSPNQVGRIYFAIDHDSGTFIVDHIGLKLYGL